MEWYIDGVTNAITTCRQEKALFIVYVKDDSDNSKAMDDAWNSEQVQSVLTANKFVALRLQKDSVEHQQFDRLFPVLLFPCVFCINALSGQQLVVASGPQTGNQLKSLLCNAFMKLNGVVAGVSGEPELNLSAPTPPLASTSGTTTAPANVSVQGVPEEQRQTAMQSQSSVETSGSRPRADSDSGDDGGNASRGGQRLDELRQQLRKKRDENQKQKEKREELERRDHGRQVEKFRKEQEDRLNQSWILERKKEKELERRAREEVRAKLEQDRRERQARRQEAKTTTTLPNSEVRQREVVRTRSSDPNSSCRVQVKLPGGSSTVFSLSATDTLSLLRTKISEHLKVVESNISLMTMFPQRELTPSQDTESMMDLGLTPTAVVLARLPKGMLSSAGSSGGVLGMILGIFQFLFQLLVMLKDGIVGLFSSSSSSGGNTSSTSTQSRYGGYQSKSSRVRQFRQEDYEDDDEDKKKKKSTYNGNSTQQQ